MAAQISKDFAVLNLSFVPGDDFIFTVTFPFDISDYTIIAKIGTEDFDFDSLSDTSFTLSLTEEQTAKIKNNSHWFLKLQKEDTQRTYIKGVYTRI